MKKILLFIGALAFAIGCIIILPAFFGNMTYSTHDADTSSNIVSVVFEEDDEDASITGSDTSFITLEGKSIAFEGSGATVEGNTVTIVSAGIYSIQGTLNDGQIIVDTKDEETVKLVLNGVDIACSTSAPIYVLNAEKTVITLENGTENYLTDGDIYQIEDAETDEPNAALFSKDDLTINGQGSLIVYANYNDGITSKDDLKITGGNITVHAVNDGIRGRDSVAVKAGSLTIYAGGDGLQSNNDEDPEKGYISIEGGSLDITAGADGLQAKTFVSISGGEIRISTGGGSIISSSNTNWGSWNVGSTVDDSGSAKGVKAGVSIVITGGELDIDSSDDSLHSNDRVTISGGRMVLASGDDGIHADSAIEIHGGDLRITKCYEGIESAVITINEGTIRIVASDDGINIAGGNDASSINGRPGQNSFAASGAYHLNINGGYIVIDAAGDGIDANGSIEITDGEIIINGPTSSNNGALDYDGACKMTGGTLIAAGSAGMAQAPGTSSTRNSVMITFPSTQAAGTMVHIESESGEEVITFVPTKAYQSVVVCSPKLKTGVTYGVYSGGSSTGTVSDGLYSGGIYSSGTQVATFTISSTVTYAGSSGTVPRGPGSPGDRFMR